MTVLLKWTDWRHYAAVIVDSAGTYTFNNANPDTITRASGDFTADGIKAGMVCEPIGTASNDLRRYHVDTVAATKVTLDAADVIVAESAVACTLRCYFVDADGLEQYPGPFGDTNLVRSGGFTGGLTGTPQPYAGGAFEVTANSTAADSVYGTDEYDWYLSQRTDDAAVQFLDIAQKADAGGNSYSGTVSIVHNATATAELGALTNPTIDQIVSLFKYCHLYCRRRSDGAIQWIDLLREMLS